MQITCTGSKVNYTILPTMCMGRRHGEEVWEGSMGRRYGDEVWEGGMGRTHGEQVLEEDWSCMRRRHKEEV